MKLLHGDCLEVMQTLEDNSVDAIICDPPYGTTQCKWDAVIPFEPMWEQLKRIAKKQTPIVLFGNQPFTSALIMSNVKMFKYTWVWDKKVAGNFYNAKYMPMKEHEDICVFYQAAPTYNPQRIMRSEASLKRYPIGKQEIKIPKKSLNKTPRHAVEGGIKGRPHKCAPDGTRNPRSIIEFNKSGSSKESGKHPTQKPVALMEYLVKTYTNEGDTVLDFTMGSGSTGVACVNLSRDFIGIELEREYYDIATERINTCTPPILQPH